MIEEVFGYRHEKHSPVWGVIGYKVHKQNDVYLFIGVEPFEIEQARLEAKTFLEEQ